MSANHIKKWAFVIALLLASAQRAICNASIQNVATPRYQLLKQAAHGMVVLFLRDTTTNRTIWHYRCIDINRVAWSGDRRALAFTISSDIYRFRLLYWRVGHRLRLAPYPKLFADFDAVADLRWSPDDRCFAFLGGNTEFDSGGPIIGTLCCVNATTGHYFFGPSNVGRFRWVSGDHLRYVPTYRTPDRRHSHSVYTLKPSRTWSGTVTDRVWEDPAWQRDKIHLLGRRWPWQR